MQKKATQPEPNVFDGQVQIESKGKGSFQLVTSVVLPRTRSEIFQFFGDARNLELITPEFLNFRIITPHPIEMKQDARIDYKIRLRGIPIKWRTNITAWVPDEYFIDEQIRGPYRRWHHEHQFEELSSGETRMTDIVDYRVWLAPIFHPLMVKNDLIRIFEYRQRKIVELFGGRG